MKEEKPYLFYPWITIRTVVVFYLISAIGLSLQAYYSGHYNNYLVFSRPVINLHRGWSLYEYYNTLYEDVFRYSPAFAFLAGAFSYLPDLAGLIIWNLLNTALLSGGYIYFSKAYGRPVSGRITGLLIMYLGWLVSTQNCQSNPLIAGFIFLAIGLLKKEKPFLAALCLSLCAFTKFYGLAAAVLFLFYPRKLRFIFSMTFWCALLIILPWLGTTMECLLKQYVAWFNALTSCPVKHQLSILGIMTYWFHILIPFVFVQIGGLLITLLPLLRFKRYAEALFQQLMLASLLIYVVIFNTMAESPTYIIAIAGVAVWFVALEKKNWVDYLFLALVILVTSNANSDLFPLSWRQNYIAPYSFIAVPCVLVWIRIQQRLWKS
ncbi:MAG: glycosyltransferase family 87 protein [Bacteroidia bacterium]